MAIFSTVSQKELQRIAQIGYEGKYVRVSLASLDNEGYNSQSPVSDWDSIKISGNGYQDFWGSISTGSYDSGDARYEMPEIIAEFTASGSGYSFNTVYIVLGTPNTVNISNAALTSNVATITTTSNHGFTVGNVVIINGATNSVFNGTHTVATTPSDTTFTYARTNADISSAASTGTATEITQEDYLYGIIEEVPGVILSPAQTVTYKVQFCTDD